MSLELKDKTANQNDISINSNVTDDTDVPGSLSGAVYSALFDSGSDSLTVLDSASLRITGDLTVEFWVKVTTDTIGNPGVNKGNGTSGYAALMSGQEDPVMYATVATVTKGKYCNPSAAALNTWEHWAFVYTSGGSPSMVLYKNGSSVTPLNTLGSGPPSSLPDTSGINLILTGNGGNASRLCDVRIWNTARSAGQISANYQSFLVGNEAGLVANWPFQPFTRPSGRFFAFM